MQSQDEFIDEQTEEFVSQFMHDIDLIRQEFKLKNIKYKPHVIQSTRRNSNVQLNVTRIKPFFQSMKGQDLDQLITANQTKAHMHTSSYKSLNPKLILRQFERGEIRRSQPNIIRPLASEIKHTRGKSQLNSSNNKFKLLPMDDSKKYASQTPINPSDSFLVPGADKYHFKLEPLSKYDEGRIKYYERDQEIIRCLQNKIPVTGYTRFKEDEHEQWVNCEIINVQKDAYMVFIPSLGKTKLVTRANMLLESENKDEFVQRFQQAKNNRKQTIWSLNLQKHINELAESQEVLITKDIMNGVVNYVFENTTMRNHKQEYFSSVIEETMDNYKESVLKFQVLKKFDFELEIPQIKNKIKLLDDSTFQRRLHYLDIHYNHTGLIPQLKQSDRLEILRVIQTIMEFTHYATNFRLYSDLKKVCSQRITHGPSQLLEVFQAEFKTNVNKLDMFIYKIESSIDHLKKHINQQLNVYLQTSIQVIHPDTVAYLQRFENICLKTFNQVLSSFLHLSVQQSFNELISHMNRYIEQTPVQLMIENVNPFFDHPQYIMQDLELIIDNYIQLQSDIENDMGYKYQYPAIQALGFIPFIEIKINVIPPAKYTILIYFRKKQKHTNIIKYVILQRNNIYHASQSLKMLKKDIFRDNLDEIDIKKDVSKFSVIDNRLGWYSWKNLKILMTPSLSDIELSFKESIENTMKLFLNQNALGQCVSEEKISVASTIGLLEQFRNYINKFFYEQYINIIPIAILANNFKFYLSENSFISQLISIYEGTHNNILVGQERKNLTRDLKFVEHQIPSTITVGIFKINLQQFKDGVAQMIKQGIAQLDASMQKQVENLVQENATLSKQLSEFLNEIPQNVQKYIEMIKYIKSKELEDKLQKIRENQILAEKTMAIVQEYQVPFSEKILSGYLNQLALVYKLEKHRDQINKQLDSSKLHFKRLIDETTEQLKRKFKKLFEEIRDFTQECDQQKSTQYLTTSKNIEEQLNEIIAKSKQINEQEAFLGQDISNFENFEEEQKKFQKFCDLWDLAEKIRYKLGIWQNTLFLDVDVHDMIESSRDYAYQLHLLVKQFQNPVFIGIIESLSKEITQFEPYFQVLLVLKEIASKEKNFERVIKRLSSQPTSISKTIPELISYNLEAHQDYIIQESILTHKEQALQQHMNDYENQFRDIQFKSVNLEMDDYSFPVVTNTTQIIQTLREIELELHNYSQSDIPTQIRERCIFLQLTCQNSAEMLHKIFYIQEVLMQVAPYFRSFSKPQNEQTKLREEHKKRFDSLKRLGLMYFQQILDRQDTKQDGQGEFSLLKDKLHQQEITAKEIQDTFHHEMKVFRIGNSRLSFLTEVEMSGLFYDIYNPLKVHEVLLKLFPNIKSFQLSDDPQKLQILCLQSEYEEDFFVQEDLTISWKNTNIEMIKYALEVIEKTYIQQLKQNIYGYLPVIMECNYNLVKIYKYVQQHQLLFQSLYLLLQLNFYHDLTLILFDTVTSVDELKKLDNVFTEQMEQFVHSQTNKNRKQFSSIQYIMYNQIILLFIQLKAIIQSFLSNDESQDEFMSSKQLQSFEYLTLPKFSLEGLNIDPGVLQETVVDYKNQVNGVICSDQPSKFTQAILKSTPSICLMSMNCKQYYSFDLQASMDLIMVTPSMQKSFFSMIILMQDVTGIFLQGSSRMTTISQFCQMLAKPTWQLQDYSKTSYMIGCLLQRGIWAVCSNHITQISAILIEVRNQLYSQKTTIQIEGQQFYINQDFRILGVLSNNIKAQRIEAYRVIHIEYQDNYLLTKAFSYLLGIGVTLQNRLSKFWDHVNLIFVTFEQRADLPDLSVVLKQALRQFREYIIQENLKMSNYLIQFFEAVGDKMNLNQKKLLVSLCHEEFYEEYLTVNQERNLKTKMQIEYATEFLKSVPNPRLLGQLCAFMDHFEGSIVIVGKQPQRLIELSAYVQSRLKNIEFQVIYFPVYTISQDDLLGYFDENEQYQAGLLEATSNYHNTNEEQDSSKHYYMRRMLPQQLIAQNVRGRKKLNLTISDWFVFDNPVDIEPFYNREVPLTSGQLLKIKNQSVVLVDTLQHQPPKPLRNYILCEEVYQKEEIFLQSLMKLVTRHQFFEKLRPQLKALYYFIGHHILDRKTVVNFTKLLRTLLNELRKISIANGLFSYNDFHPDERKFIYDPYSLLKYQQPQKNLSELTEAVFIMCIIYGVKPFVQVEQHKQLTQNILERIDKYQEFLEYQSPFACSLTDDLRKMGLNMFQVYFDFYTQKWKGEPELTTQVDQLLLYQSSLSSNILTAYEVVRLNPDAMKISQIKGQFAAEIANLNQKSLDLQISYDHYLIILMAFSGHKIFVQDDSLNPITKILARILELNDKNQVVKMDSDRTLANFAAKIQGKANFVKQYAVNLENRNLSTNIILENLNMDHQSVQFVRSLISYDAFQAGQQTLRLADYRFLASTREQNIPEYVWDRCFIGKLRKEGPLLLYSIYKNRIDPYKHIALANLKYELGELIPSFLQVVDQPLRFFQFFKSIYPTKYSYYDDMQRFHLVAKNYSQQIRHIAKFYDEDPSYDLYMQLNDEEFTMTVRMFKAEMDNWMMYSPSRREVSQIICKVIAHTVYSAEYEFSEIEQIFLQASPEHSIDPSDIWQYINDQNQQVLELSVEKLERLNEIFKLVEGFVPHVFLKANMNFTTVSSALNLLSQMHGWDPLSIDLSKVVQDDFVKQIDQFIAGNSSVKILLLRVHSDHESLLKVLTDKIDEMDEHNSPFMTQQSPNLRIVICYHQRPALKHFNHRFKVSKSLAQNPTLYEIKFGKHFNQQSIEFDEMISTNDRSQVYRLLWEMDQYFLKLENKFKTQGIFNDLSKLVDEKLKSFNLTEEKLKSELQFLQNEEQKLSHERDIHTQQIAQQMIKLQDLQKKQEGLTVQIDKCLIEKAQSEEQAQAQYIKYVNTLLQMTNYSQMGVLKESAHNCIIYHQFLLHFTGERKIDKITSEEKFHSIKMQRQHEFQSLMSNENVKNKLRNLLNVQFNALSKEVKEALGASQFAPLLNDQLFNSDLSHTIHLIVEQFVKFQESTSHYQAKYQQQVEELQEVKELLKRVQIDQRLTKDHLGQNDKKALSFASQIESVGIRIKKLAEHLILLSKIKNGIKTEIWRSYTANKFFINIDDRLNCLFVIALYVVLQSTESNNKIKLPNYQDSLALIPWTLQQQPLYYKIFKEIDQIDHNVVDKLCIINFFVQIRLPYLIVEDDSNFVLRMLKLENYQFETHYYTEHLNFNQKGIQVFVEPSDEFLDEASQYLGYLLEQRQTNYQMFELNAKKIKAQASFKQSTRNLKATNSKPQDDQEFYLIIICSNVSSRISKEFIHIRINDPYLPSSHQRLLDMFVHTFKRKEMCHLIDAHKSFVNQTVEAQEVSMAELLYLLKQSEPTSEEYILALYKFSFDPYKTKYNDVASAFSSLRQRIIKDIKESPQYQSLENIVVPAAEAIPEENEDAGSPHRSLSVSSNQSDDEFQDRLQTIKKDEALKLERFMSKRYLKEGYLYPIQNLQLLAFPFMEISGFLIYMKKLLSKLSKVSGIYQTNESFYWLTVRESMLKTFDYCGHAFMSKTDHATQFVRFWFMQIICSIPNELQTVLYAMIAFKYMKLKGTLNMFMRNSFLHGYINPDVDLIELQEKFFPSKLLIQPAQFMVSKLGAQDDVVNMLVKRQGPAPTIERKGSNSNTPPNTRRKSSIQEFRRVSQNYLPKQNALMNLFTNEMEVLNSINKEEFDKVYLKQVMFQLNHSHNQLRASVVHDQSDFHFFTQTFRKQLQRLSTNMRLSQVQQIQGQVSLAMVSLRSAFIGTKNIMRQRIQQNRHDSWDADTKEKQKNLLAEIENQLQNYKLEYYPPNYHRTINNLIQLLGKSQVKQVFNNFLSDNDQQKWINFALIPVSNLVQNLSNNQIPLPISADVSQLSLIELLLIFKHIKPAALSIAVDHLLGQQMLKDLYYCGTHNFKFMSESHNPLVTIIHTQPILDIIQDQVILNTTVVSCDSKSLLPEIQSGAQNGNWIIVQGLPRTYKILYDILRIVQQRTNQSFKLWVSVNIDEPHDEKLLQLLMNQSHRTYVNHPDTLKETISSLFQHEISRIVMGEAITSPTTKRKRSKIKMVSVTLNSFVELKYSQSDEDSYSVVQFMDQIKVELKYNLYFILSLLKQMARFPSKVGTKDLKLIIDTLIKGLKGLSVHPFVFFYKLLVDIHLHNGSINELQQFLFQTIRILLFKQEQQQTLIQNENEFSSWQLYMFKQLSGEEHSGQIAKFLSLLPEKGPIDLIGMSAAKEFEIQFKESQSLMDKLHLLYDQEPKKNKISKQQYLSEKFQPILSSCKQWLQRFQYSNKQDELIFDFWVRLEEKDEDDKKPLKLAGKLNAMVRSKVMNEIKKHKDIKVTTKSFAKTLQEQTHKSIENHLGQFYIEDRDRMSYFKLKDGKANFQKQILQIEVQSQIKELENFDYESPDLFEKVKMIMDRFQFQQDNINSTHLIWDLRRMYHPDQLVYSFMLMKQQESKLHFQDMRIRCERAPYGGTGKEFTISNLYLVNAYLNLVNDNLEDGNTFSEEIQMPPLRLKIYPRASNQQSHQLTMEFDDKLHQNLALEHQRQMEENLNQKEVNFSHYLSRKADSPRTCVIKNLQRQKQEQISKKIYFVKLPIRWRGSAQKQGEFYFKSLMPQHHWVHKNAHISN